MLNKKSIAKHNKTYCEHCVLSVAELTVALGTVDLWPVETAMPRDACVIRLIKHTPHHYPPDAAKPQSAAFRLTDADVEDGKSRNRYPLLSVWDGARIALLDAKANLLRDTKQGTYTGFVLNVAAVEALNVGALNTPVSVHRDPDLRDGVICGDAHGGIQGLHYDKDAPKEEKLRIKNIWAQLADECEKHKDEAPGTRSMPG